MTDEMATFVCIVDNGSFSKGDALPAYWGRHPRTATDNNYHARDTDTFRSPPASGLIHWLDPVAGPNKAHMQWNKYTIPVEGGTELIFAGWVKTAGVTPREVGAHFYDAAGRHLSFATIRGPARADDWTYFSGTFPVLENPSEASSEAKANIAFPIFSSS